MVPGDAALLADGVDVPVRVVGLSRAWSFRPAAAAREVAFRLELDATNAPNLPGAPRLSATPDGDAIFRHARDFNSASSIATVGICGYMGLLYAALFALDRRRSEHAWVALQAALSVVIASGYSGVLVAAIPRWAYLVSADSMLAVMLAARGFARSYFRRPPMHAAWPVGVVVVVLGGFLVSDAIARSMLAMGIGVLCLVGAIWQIVSSVREFRSGRDRFPAAMLGAAWVFAMVVTVPDFISLMGLGEIAGGFKGLDLGMGVFCVFQAFILGRDHIRSLRDAETRVTELETQRRELDQLNEDLRYQVAERSRELTEALRWSVDGLAPASLAVGDVFDARYRVTRPLGRGGMGAVYEVERIRDGRGFALKVVTAALTGRQAARFAQEAEIGARLHHENLVSIVDVGVTAGATPFLVMELVQGGSLEDRRGRFGDRGWALPILRQIAAGLAELHANRIVHRDLKPGNVLLVEGNRGGGPVAKISDFGISFFGVPDDGVVTADDSVVDVEGATLRGQPSPRALTQSGTVMGTPSYMPPEALREAARHPSADVFSFGILAYEALTGQSPFTVPPVLLARSGKQLPEPAAPEGVARPVAEVVLACLRAEPSQRPRAREVAEAMV
jgi:hypothetical protein